MPKKNAASKKEAAEKRSGSKKAEVLSDEEIEQERKLVTQFERGDKLLDLASWGLWGLAFIYFVFFASALPALDLTGMPELLQGVVETISDPSLCLLSSGIFMKNLSTASPNGSWSSWRSGWHGLWSFCGIAGAAAFGRFSTMDRVDRPSSETTQAPLPPSNYGLVLAGVLALSASAFAGSKPTGTPPRTGKNSGVFWGRLLLVSDAVLGFACVVLLMAANAALWSDPLGGLALWASTVPLFMWALGTFACKTDNECLAAVPPILAHCMLVSARLIYTTGVLATVPALVWAALHAALYLPLPAQEPDTNPFYSWFSKYCRRTATLFKSPVSGWGDSAEDGD